MNASVNQTPSEAPPKPHADITPDTSPDVTHLLQEWSRGNSRAGDRLLEVVYRELHGMAAHYLRGERREITLQSTALVHEAYLRLIHQHRASWQNRAHFFSVASKMMRRVLVDHARGRLSTKRGGDRVKVPWEHAENLASGDPASWWRLDDALESLAAVDPRKAKIVELRFFGGLQFQEIARHLEISTATLNRHWRIARGWLYSYLHASP